MWQYIDEFGGAFYKSDDRIDYQQFLRNCKWWVVPINSNTLSGFTISVMRANTAAIRLRSLCAGVFAPNYDNETEAWALYGQTTIRRKCSGQVGLDSRLSLYRGTKDIKYLYEYAGPVLLPGPYEDTLVDQP